LNQVGDFGVSALLSSPPAVERVGTVTYHAPEVQSALQYSVKSDVWAIGVIMWEAMQLRPPGGEPITVGMINFPSLVQFYGQAARELLLMHLAEYPDQRAQAGKIKETMLQLLQDSSRQAVASRALSSQVMAQSDAARQAEWMRPRSVQVPKDTSELQTPDIGQEMNDASSGRSQLDSASDVGMHSDSLSGHQSAGQHESVADENDKQQAETPKVLELSAELGIFVTAGTGGEFGAWKIASLPADKPAAKSNGLVVGEYLWEINGKIIFGMPFQLISSLAKGKSPVVRLGVKSGLGLSIREALVYREGHDAVAKTEDPVASNPQEQRIASPLPVSPAIPHTPVAEESPQNASKLSPALPPAESTPQATAPLSPVPASPEQNNGTVTPDEMPNMEKIVRFAPAAAQRSAAPAPVPLSGATTSASPQEIAGQDEPANVLAPQDIQAINSPLFHSPLGTPGEAGPGHSPPNFEQEAKVSDTAAVLAPIDSPTEKKAPIKVTTQGSATIAGDGHYSGELLDGKPFGMGTATWPQQGHTYQGEWRNGVMHGQGTATYLNGDRYDGEWANGKRSGLGRYAHGSGDIYEGLWSNERKHGLGVDSFADGRGYRGEFMENKFAGVGAYFTVDGAVYQVIQMFVRRPLVRTPDARNPSGAGRLVAWQGARLWDFHEHQGHAACIC